MTPAVSHRDSIAKLLRDPAALQLPPRALAEALLAVLPHVPEEAAQRAYELLAPAGEPAWFAQVTIPAEAGLAPHAAADLLLTREGEFRKSLGQNLLGAEAWKLLELQVTEPAIPEEIITVLSHSPREYVLLLDPGISLLEFQERYNANVKDEFVLRIDEASKAHEYATGKLAHPRWRIVPRALVPGTLGEERAAQLTILEAHGLKPGAVRDLTFLIGLCQRNTGERLFPFVYTRCAEPGVVVGLSRTYAYNLRGNDDGLRKGSVGLGGIPVIQPDMTLPTRLFPPLNRGRSAEVPVVVGGENQIILTEPGDNCFYRLLKP